MRYGSAITPCCVRFDDLDLADLRADLSGPETAIDDPDAAFLGLDDSHGSARDGVHVGGHDRPLQRDAPRQAAGQVDPCGIPAREDTALGRQDEVVERAAAYQLEHATSHTRVHVREYGHVLGIVGWMATLMALREIEAALRARLAGSLPGVEAQMRFVPNPARTGWVAGHFPADSRAAAALLLLYPSGGDGVAVPLTVRASGLARHAGQISLPGGATDEGETLVEAALREASEEIGVDPAAVRVLGELTPVHVIVSGFTLHPIVGVVDERPAFQAAPGEVDEILEVSLDDLRDASRIRVGTRMREGLAVEYPYFDLLGHQVWGATAMVLGEFICLMAEIPIMRSRNGTLNAER